MTLTGIVVDSDDRRRTKSRLLRSRHATGLSGSARTSGVAALRSMREGLAHGRTHSKRTPRLQGRYDGMLEAGDFRPRRLNL